MATRSTNQNAATPNEMVEGQTVASDSSWPLCKSCRNGQVLVPTSGRFGDMRCPGGLDNEHPSVSLPYSPAPHRMLTARIIASSDE